MKKENKRIDKSSYTEVTGNRTELNKYLGEQFKVPAFVTNTYGYLGEKRLVTEVKIHEYFINHVWFKSERIGNLSHGYQELDVEVISYQDQITKETKYGLKYIGLEGKKYIDNTMIKPKWMKDD